MTTARPRHQRRTGRNDPCPCGSGRKFKKCHAANGTAPTALHTTRPRVHEKVEPISFADFASRMEQSPHHPLAIATTAVKRFRERVGFLQAATDDGFTARDAGAVALAAFYRREVTVYDAPQVPLGNAEEADAIFAFVLQRLGPGWGTSSSDVRLAALQFLCNQASISGQQAFQTYRTLFLLELEDEHASCTTSFLDHLFMAAYGCSAREYMALMSAMWMASHNNGNYLDGPGLVRNSPSAEKLAPIAARILSENSLPTREVMATIDEIGHHELEGLVPAFFARYPFLEFKPGTHLAGPHPYVRMAAVNGPWFRALELARKDAALAGSPRPETPDANRRMGERFEKLVGWLLGHVVRDEDLVREHRYRKAGDLAPDFLVFEDGDAQVTLVQAKLKRLSPGAFFGFDFDAFVRDAEGAMAETVWKSIRYLHRVHTFPSCGHLLPEAEVIAQRVRRSKRILLLGVLAAAPSVFHVDLFRRCLQAGIDRNLTPDEKVWLTANANRLVGWHVLDSEALSEFVALRQREGLLESIGDYISLKDFGSLITSGEELLLPFHDYFVARGRQLGRTPRLPEVDAAVQRFGDWLKEYIFGGVEQPR